MYTYDDANRVKTIEHVSASGLIGLMMTYSYDRRNLPTQILESSEIGLVAPTTYGSANNRLMKTETVDITTCDPTMSSCPLLAAAYCLYNFAGNVTRVTT